ncbi:hypothetical protein CMI37_26990 [Candidatus Pacearchaeota archaeon]|nr:hypothetical protein [Candidatus Pacearchaeota archaeon]
MAGPYELPANKPSDKFLRDREKDAGKPSMANNFGGWLRTPEIAAPAAPQIGPPTSGGMLAPGVSAQQPSTSQPTQSFSELITGRTGARADASLPGWSAWLGKEDWQQDRGFSWNPLNVLEPFSYPGLRHAMNFSVATAEATLDDFRNLFTGKNFGIGAESEEEKRFRLQREGFDPDMSFMEKMQQIGSNFVSDDSHYVERMHERGFWESMAVGLLSPDMALSKVRNLSGARMGISDELLEATKHADWAKTPGSVARAKRTEINKAQSGVFSHAYTDAVLNETYDTLHRVDPPKGLPVYTTDVAASRAMPLPGIDEWKAGQFGTRVDQHGRTILGGAGVWKDLMEFNRMGVHPFKAPLELVAQIFHPAAIARDPIRQVGLYRDVMYANAIPALVFHATLKPRALGYAQRRPGVAGGLGPARWDFENPLIKQDDLGNVISDNIEQVKGLGKDEVMSMQLHDITENIGHYAFTGEEGTKIKAFLEEVRETSKALTKLLDDEPGVTVRKIQGESDYQYVHRVVRTYRDKLGDDYVRMIVNQLEEKGYTNKRIIGEEWDAYIIRILQDLKAQPSLIQRLNLDDDFFDGLEDLANLANVDIRGGRIDKPRSIDYVINGLQRVGYEPDIVKELTEQATITYRMITDQRVKQFISEFAITKDELLDGLPSWLELTPEQQALTTQARWEDRVNRMAGIVNQEDGGIGRAPGLNAEIASNAEHVRVLDVFRRAVGVAAAGAGIGRKTVTPRYVISQKDLDILRTFPGGDELAEIWEMMMTMDVTSGFNVISRFKSEVAGFANIKKGHFNRLLTEVRIEEWLENFPTAAVSGTVRDRGRRWTRRGKATTRRPRTTEGRFAPGEREAYVLTWPQRIQDIVKDARTKLKAAGGDPKAIRSVGMPADVWKAYTEGVQEIRDSVHKGLVTQREIGAVLRKHSGSQIKANKMLLKIYKDEFEGPGSPIVRRRRRAALSRAESLGDAGENIFDEATTRRDTLEHLRNMLTRQQEVAKFAQRSALRRKRDVLDKYGLGADITPSMGQAIGVPGVSGKFIPGQIIDNLTGTPVFRTGADLATAISERFGYSRMGTEGAFIRNALRIMGLISNTYRLLKASFDVGLMFIQLSGLLGIDFANLIGGTASYGKDLLSETMQRGLKSGYVGPNQVAIRGNRMAAANSTIDDVAGAVAGTKAGRATRAVSGYYGVRPEGPRFTNLFLTSAKHSLWSALDPEHMIAYWMQPENYRVMGERISHGSLIQPSEMTMGVNDIINSLDRIARWQIKDDAGALTRAAELKKMARIGTKKAAPFGKGVVKQTLGRADAAWTGGRNVAANEMWKAYAPFAEKTGNLVDLARMTNLMTGILSMENLGYADTRRRLLSAIGFFSPRYTFAQVALIGHILKGGYTGKQARNMVMGSIAFNTTFFTLAAISLGQEPKVNPLPKRLGGDGADLWTVEIGGRRVGIGGIHYAPMRIIMATAGEAMAGEGTITGTQVPDALIEFDMSNPILRAYRGKAAGVTSQAWTLISGRNFLGEPVRGEESAVKDYLSTVVAPIWSEELITEGGGAWPTALADFYGLRSFPESQWDIYHNMLAEVAGKDGTEISDYEEKVFRSHIPEIQQAYEAAIADSKRRGRNQETTDYFARLEKNRLARDNKLNDAQRLIDDGTYTWGIDVRKFIQDTNTEYRITNQVTRDDPRFADVAADMKQDDPKFAEDKAYFEYWDIWFDPQWLKEDALGEINFQGRDHAIAQWKFQQDPTVLEKVEYRNMLHRENSPMLLRQYWHGQEILKAYWNINNTIIQDFPSEVQRIWNGYLAADRIQQRHMLRQYPILNQITAMRDGERHRLRMTNPALDVELLKWGYTTVPMTDEGWMFYEGIVEGRNPLSPSMPDPSMKSYDTSDFPNMDELLTNPPEDSTFGGWLQTPALPSGAR